MAASCGGGGTNQGVRGWAAERLCSGLSPEVGRPVGFLRSHIPLASCCIQTTAMPKESSPCCLCSQSGLLPGLAEKPQASLRNLWL